MTRRYTLRRRAERQLETRQRIVKAAVELHEELGPARTTISAIAERAGVERLTIYRHFPDEISLFNDCTKYYWGQHPFPDPTPWTQIADPVARLEMALGEVFAYHRRTEGMTVSFLRDLPIKPVVAQTTGVYVEHWTTMRDVLAVGWEAGGERRSILLAALGHALAFPTWHSLVREQGLDDADAVQLIVAMVRRGLGSYSESS